MFREPLDREITALAFPSIGSGLTIIGHHWIDMYWVGNLPQAEEAVAALGVGTFAVWIFGSISSLVGTGLTSLVGRYVGADRPEAARYVAFQGLLGGTLLALAAALIGWWLAPSAYRLAGAEPGVREAGTVFVRTYWSLGLPILLLKAAEAIFRGYGNARTPFRLSLLSLVINAGLDPVLIHGWGPVPHMGVAGAALATVIAYGASGGALWILLGRSGRVSWKRPHEDLLRLRPETPITQQCIARIDPAVLYRISRVGLPLATSGVLFSLIYLAVSRIAAEAGGTAGLAGLGVGHRGESIAFVVCTGYSIAAASLVGRKLGAESIVEAERAAWRSALQGACLCGAWALVLVLAGRPIAGLLLDEAAAPGAYAHAVSYFHIVAWCLVPQAFEIVLEGAFGGAGLTIPPMLITVSLSLLRIPLGYWLAIQCGYGVEGLWWTLTATSCLRGLVMSLWFARGTWKEHSV